jgi:hypothetical protein
MMTNDLIPFDDDLQTPRLSDVQKAAELFASLVAQLDTRQWSGWVIFAIAAFESEAGPTAMNNFLADIADIIEARRKAGYGPAD